MATNNNDDVFYTLDEEKRTLVPHAINIGDGLLVLMRISKKYLTKDPDDTEQFVNINIGDIRSITYGLQRKTTRDYIPGQRDAHTFSKGHVMGSGRMICPVLDRELISFIFNSVETNMPNNKFLDKTEAPTTFGFDFELKEQSETELTTNKEELVGGTSSTFAKKKEYVYLDDIPPFDIRIIARADSKKHVTVFGEKNETADSFETGAIYERKLQRVLFVSDSLGADAVNPTQDQVIDFAIFGNDSGWLKMA